MKTKNASLALKLSALAGAAGIAPAAHAAIIQSTTLPLSPPSSGNTSTLWDIDGSSGNGFRLVNSSTTFGSRRCATLLFGSHHAKMVATNQHYSGFRIANMALNAVVGPTLPNGLSFIGANYGWRGRLTSNGNAKNPFFPVGTPGYFGFKFTGSNSTTEYGWGTLLVTGTPVGQGFTIQNAYYDNTGASIMVGQTVAIPEPSSMALLALGATGLAAWRLRRKETEVKAA